MKLAVPVQNAGGASWMLKISVRDDIYISACCVSEHSMLRRHFEQKFTPCLQRESSEGERTRPDSVRDEVCALIRAGSPGETPGLPESSACCHLVSTRMRELLTQL